MKLIIQPDDGVVPLLTAIKNAKKSVEIAIFRFDRKDVELALKAAASAKGWRRLLHDKDVKDTMKGVVKQAVKEAVREAQGAAKEN